MEVIIKNGSIVKENEVFVGDLLVKNGKISKIGENLLGENILDATGKFVVPGFIDMHIHGANGYDTMDGTTEAIESIAKFLCNHGVTSFLPTMLTQSKEDLLKSLESIKQFKDKLTGNATVLGAHMEGPYFNTDYKGAQNPEFIREGSVEELKKFIEVEKDIVKLMSLAPEKNSDEVIQFLSENSCIVSMGHTGASCDRVKEAVKAGVTHGTHTYNGMKGLHHREPGALGGIMLMDEIYGELILDAVHVHPDSAKILVKCKGSDKVVLVSDSIMATGLPEGDYSLGGLPITVKNGEARLLDGTLAGSTLTLDLAFKNVIELLGLSIIDAVKMSSTNQAKELKINKGLISQGYDADLLILNEDYSIDKVLINGIKVRG